MAEAGPGGATTIGLILLGSALALGGSIVVEFIRGWNSDRRKRRTLVRILSSEILAINSTLDSLTEEPWQEGRARASIGALHNALRRVESYWDWIMLIEDDALRRGLFEFFASLDSVCVGAKERSHLTVSQLGHMLRDTKAKGQGLLERLDAQ